MEIRNKTKRPLAVPLPGGKKLRLGPAKSSQITAKAAESAPVVKLIEEGSLEIVGTGNASTNQDANPKIGPGSSKKSGGSAGGMRHGGDR